MAARVTPLAIAAVERADAEALADLQDRYRSLENEWIRRMVVEHGRVDILATHVLGYQCQPHHYALLQNQFRHPKSLGLAFRGAGKSSICTVAKSIYYVLQNPNIRIIIASKTTGNAEAMLKEIKGHLERNERLAEIFGPQFDARRVRKWDNREIEVLPRTSNAKEATITCAGADAAIVSKHYDVGLSDDLVDEDNSRTLHMRQKVKTWYYQTLDPCLEPPDSKVKHRGEHHHLGTRYHFDDLWGYLSEGQGDEGGELKDSTIIIPALDKNGNSPWPEKFPAEYFHEKKKRAGIIVFGAQYQCDTEAMKGEIFEIDDCQPIEDADIPQGLEIFQGCDLAIGEDEMNDKFAIVTIGVQRSTDRYYVLDWFEGQLKFSKQREKILKFYDDHDPVRALVESNAYQAAQLSSIKEIRPDVRIFGRDTKEDKVTRMQKLAAIFEDKRIFFRKGLHLLIERLVLLPGGEDDSFDALDLAVRASRKTRKKRRGRDKEPGLL